jgi:hypothetical protein
MIPVFNHSVSDWVVDAIGLGVGNSFIADEEIQVLDSALGREMTGL